MTPSFQPSIGPSLKPSQTPSSFSDRTFQILSTSPKFSKVGNNNDVQKWCLEGKLSVEPTSSILKFRPCSPSRAHLQTWFLFNGKLSLSSRNPGTFCVKDERRSLYLMSCDALESTSSISFTSRDENTPGAIVVSRNGKTLYVAISTDKIFAKVQLFTKQSVNPSKESWQLNYVTSLEPSIAPSSQEPINVNLALNMETEQSSSWTLLPDAVSSKAVDGFIGDFGLYTGVSRDNISHTGADEEPWWWVKLDQRCAIDNIVIQPILR